MDRSEQRTQAPEGAGSQEGPAGEYLAPEILWEQEFVALALISSRPCDPNSDPTCIP